MDSKALADKIVEILDSKKGIDIEVIDVADKTTLADYFVICSGNSTTQIKALSDEVEYVLWRLASLACIRLRVGARRKCDENQGKSKE